MTASGMARLRFPMAVVERLWRDRRARPGATGIALAYLVLRWLDGGRRFDLGLGFIAGAAAVLVEITTGGFYLLPLLLWRDPAGKSGYKRWSVWLLIGTSIAIGLAWSGYAQSVREETPASAFLSMSNQLAWFFGSVATRFDLAAWRVPLVAVIALTGFGFAVWGVLAVQKAMRHRQAPFLLALLSLAVLMPLILFNLYAIHDYYWVAVAPAAAVGIGLGVTRLRELWPTRTAKRLSVGLAAAWIATIIGIFGSWSIIYGTPPEEARAMRIASYVADHSQPSDWVVIRGWGWNSTFLYYARRQGIAVPEPNPTDSGVVGGQDLSGLDLDEILADPIYGPQIFCDHEANCVVESSR